MNETMPKKAPKTGGKNRRSRAEPKPAAHEEPLPAPRAAPQSSGKEKRGLLKGLLGLLGAKHSEPQAEAQKDGQSALDRPAFTPQEQLMLANIAELHAARVADIMIPRSDIEALDTEASLGEAMRLFAQSGHSRMPVYTETLDEPRGMVHIRDILNYIAGIAFPAEGGKNGAQADKAAEKAFAALDLSAPIEQLGVIRDVLFVPPSMPAGRLLARMQASRTQMALVIDEHGGTDGLVSMEDIVELIVGDIEDEHDDDDDDIVKEAQDSWIIDAAAELEELKENLGIDFTENAPADGVETIGGLIVTALDRIPARGEKPEIVPGFVFQILDADRRRVKRIRLIRRAPAPDAQA